MRRFIKFKHPIYLYLSIFLIALFLTITTAFAATESPHMPMPPKRLPHILILATGGTISGKSSARSAIGYDAGQVRGEDLIKDIPALKDVAHFDVEQIANIASQDMSDAVWLKLAQRINQVQKDHLADAIIITHGTDTMEETAFFLDHVIQGDIPVIITGAMRPSTAISADGPANIYDAVHVGLSPQARHRGVMVVLNNDIHAARFVTKTHTTNLQTFQSHNGGILGYVDASSVRFVNRSSQRKPLSLPTSLPDIDIIYAHSNMNGNLIHDAIARHVKGLVIAGMGDGNISSSALSALKDAIKSGVKVVRSTRVGDGFTNRNVEVNDDNYGFIASYDLNPQKARILLQLLLANNITQTSLIQKEFQ